MDRITYIYCPCCGSDDIHEKLSATDYTVSKEQFAIWHCNTCSARFTQNIPDQSLIGKYYQSENYISHTDTKKGLVNSLYHIVRKRTLRHKEQLIKYFTAILKGDLLDIGAGTGAFASHLKNAGWNVVGVEPDEATRRLAFELHDISLQTAEDLFKFPPASFDAVTMWHVLEHVHALHEYLEQINIILKLTGKAFIAVPNYTSYDGELYKEYWAAYDVPRHLYHFSPRAMRLLIEKHGMKVEAIQPMWYDSFYVSLLSEQYKTGEPGNVTAAINGLLSNINAVGNHKKCSSLIYIIRKV